MLLQNVNSSINRIKASDKKVGTKSVRRSVFKDLELLANRAFKKKVKINPNAFIPFLQERDRMNKLIEKRPDDYFIELPETSCKARESKTPQPTVRKNSKKTNFPCVGSYNLNFDWVKPSFSRKVSNRSTTPSFSEAKIEIKPQVSLAFIHKPQKVNFYNKSFRFKGNRHLGIWESLKVHTPDPVKGEFRKEILDCVKANESILSKLEV